MEKGTGLHIMLILGRMNLEKWSTESQRAVSRHAERTGAYTIDARKVLKHFSLSKTDTRF